MFLQQASRSQLPVRALGGRCWAAAPARHGARADSRRRTLAGALDARIADATRSADAAKIRLAGLPARPAPCIHAGRHPSVGTREYSIDNHPARRSAVAIYEARRATRQRAMHIAHHLEAAEGFCRFRSPEVTSLVEVVAAMTHAIAFCRCKNIPNLLVDLTALSPSISPTVLDRFLIAEECAREARGSVIVAVVARPEHIGAGKFGIKVAADFGLTANIFDAESDALDWLLAQGKTQTSGTPPSQ